jgi:hypothetical protein
MTLPRAYLFFHSPLASLQSLPQTLFKAAYAEDKKESWSWRALSLNCSSSTFVALEPQPPRVKNVQWYGDEMIYIKSLVLSVLGKFKTLITMSLFLWKYSLKPQAGLSLSSSAFWVHFCFTICHTELAPSIYILQQTRGNLDDIPYSQLPGRVLRAY